MEHDFGIKPASLKLRAVLLRVQKSDQGLINPELKLCPFFNAKSCSSMSNLLRDESSTNAKCTKCHNHQLQKI